MNKYYAAIIKALIATIPGCIMTFWKIHKDVEDSETLEDLIDNVDWDAEYEKLLDAEDKKRKPLWKRVCFK